jgi:hypothetical protein
MVPSDTEWGEKLAQPLATAATNTDATSRRHLRSCSVIFSPDVNGRNQIIIQHHVNHDGLAADLTVFNIFLIRY